MTFLLPKPSRVIHTTIIHIILQLAKYLTKIFIYTIIMKLATCLLCTLAATGFAAPVTGMWYFWSWPHYLPQFNTAR
jgi:hypothetical protein